MNSLSITFLFVAFVAGPTLTYVSPSRCELINKNTGRLQRLDCLLDPESSIGPYYLPLNITRSNITETKQGVPIELNLVVMNTVTCQPLANATVDIWHADAFGKYSGIQSEGTVGQTFLRGIQVTNSSGEVQFHSIYAGWYPSRSIHIHIEVLVEQRVKHIGQLFFSNELTQVVRRAYPYSTRTDSPITNQQDDIYQSFGGASTAFDAPTGDVNSGYKFLMYVGVNPN